MVRMKGLEPPRLTAPEPKSGVSTNSTTSAKAKERTMRFRAQKSEAFFRKIQ